MPTGVRKLAIVGASARAAAFSAIRAGYDVAAADLFADADLTARCAATRVDGYPEGLADWLAATDCDAWLYTGALENNPDLVDRMAALRPLLGNGGTALRRIRDPLELQTAIGAAGLSFPETCASAAGLPRDGSWLCKTYAGASGSGVWRLDGDAAASRAERERAMFQRFVPGESAAAIFVASARGSQLLGVTRQWLGVHGERPWQYVGSVGSLECDDEILGQIARIGDVVAGHFALRGLVGVDLMFAEGRAWAIEVNPRYTASVEVLERAAGESAIARHVEACAPPAEPLGSSTAPCARREPRALVHGKAIVFAPRPATILPGFADWAMAQAALNADRPGLADIPRAGEVIPAGRPILTAFAEATSIEDCQRRLRERIADVEARLYGWQQG